VTFRTLVQVDTQAATVETGDECERTEAGMSGKRDRQQLLGNVPLFSACSDKELDRLARHAEIVEFAAGDTLMAEGELGQEFYVIVDGEVGVTRGETTVAKLGPGAYVGELALLDPGPRTATVAALRDTATVLLGSREFYAAVDESPALARKLLAGMAHRLREVSSPPAT
jgi:CRP/FNR family transcriptional regulator, cyclic AMP receptor protein